MSTRNAMTMRADLQENTATATDPYGHPVPPTWSTKATIPCRIYTRARREVIDGDKTVLVEDIRGLFPLGLGAFQQSAFQQDAFQIDMTELDRIANVRDRLGLVLFAGLLRIDTIQRRKDHLEAALQRIES